MPMDWFQGWFGPLYDELYTHRSLQEADAQVEGLMKHIGIPSGRVLDAGCGNGRHLKALRSRGLFAVGLDLSAHLLEQASAKAPGFALRCDLRRCPFRDGSFSLVASFFTGFGYFDTPQEDEALFAEFVRLTAPGGFLHLDLPDAGHVERTLVPSDERTLGRRRVVQTRWIEEGRVLKRIDVFEDGRKTGEHWERVRLWSRQAIEAVARRAGLEPVACLGDSVGGRWEPGAARMGMIWRKPL